MHLLRWIVLGAASGVLAGLSSAAFLEVLNWATGRRLEHGWLLYLLPAAGLVVGLAYHHLGGRAGGGNSLIIEEIHEPIGVGAPADGATGVRRHDRHPAVRRLRRPGGHGDPDVGQPHRLARRACCACDPRIGG